MIQVIDRRHWISAKHRHARRSVVGHLETIKRTTSLERQKEFNAVIRRVKKTGNLKNGGEDRK
jgi:hypothetical protein